MISIRALKDSEKSQLPRFLALAAHEDGAQTVWDNPNLARYIENFGRAGDCAVVAQNDEEIIGIAWARFWSSDDHGFGWVDEQTPEMAIGVEADFRDQGVGARLIGALKSELRVMNATQMSLNVRADSPAVRLYHRLSFEKIAGSERRNRTGGVSFDMLAQLN